MPSTVSVNMLTVVHAASTGITTAFPDVCKTPAPPAPFAPIPYPNISMSSDTASATSTVKADGKPFMIKGANFKMSSGDEAGSMMGMVSNKIKGKSEPKMFSFDCKADGQNIMRMTDIMLANIGGTANTPPAAEVQGPMPALPGMANVQDKDKPDPKITELKFSTTKCCCGDEIQIEAKTTDFPDDTKLGLTLLINGKKKALPADVCPDIKGNEGKQKWQIKRGKYKKDCKLKLTVSGLGGPKDSSNELDVQAPADAKQTVLGNRSTPAYVKVTLPTGIETWAPNGKSYGWGYGYDIELKKGVFSVTRKIQFTGHAASAAQKYAWKSEIENIWNRRYKLHRTQCKRGDDCSCADACNCCTWMINIKCEWGGGHGDPVTLHAGANDPNGWGNGNWWYSNTWWEQGAGVPATVRAHEFGHLIGMYDEYPAGACEATRVWANVPDSIMASGSKVYERFVTDFKSWFDSKAGSVVGSTKLIAIA